MSVMLNAAGCLDFTAQLAGYDGVAALLDDAETHARTSRPWFLPYLSGERTPHNDVNAKGVFYGFTPDTQRADLANATLEGVGFALLDGIDALCGRACARQHHGDRRRLAQRVLDADARRSERPCADLACGRRGGPALAPRASRISRSNRMRRSTTCPQPPIIAVHEPDRAPRAAADFRALYRALAPVFATGV